MSSIRISYLMALALVALAAGAWAETLQDMHYPDLNSDGSRVVFSYQGDLWIADLDDEYHGRARRITVSEGYESRPRFSPDDAWIAFSSDRYGNNDLFRVPAAGGEIERLTHHSAGDSLGDWSPDGAKLVFYSSRREHKTTAPYELEIATGRVRPLFKDVFPASARGYSADGRYVIGNRQGESWWRKGYRGSMNSNLYRFNLETRELEDLTEFDGQDVWGYFSADGTEIYFVTQRFDRPNLAAMDLETGEVREITRHREDGVIFPSISGDRSTLVYEWNFGLWIVDVRGGVPKQLVIDAPIDYRENFEAEETRTSGVEEMAPNRDGSWVAVRMRDDIFLIKPEFEDGSIRVTDFPGADDEFVWHPDGKRLMYVSHKQRTGDIWQYDLEAEEKSLLLEDPDAYLHLFHYSHDGMSLLYRKGYGGDGVFAVDPETGEIRQVLEAPDVRDLRISPDGLWVAADIDHALSGRDVYIRRLDGGEWINVTRDPRGNSSPRWSPDGEKLFFVSSRSGSGDIYCIDLQRQPVEFDDYEAQFAELAEEDENEGGDESQSGGSDEDGDEAEETEDRPDWQPEPIEPMEIDTDRIHERARRLTTHGSGEGIVGFTQDGERLIFTRGDEIWAMNLEGEEEKQHVNGSFSGLRWVRLTGDRGKLFFVSDGDVHQVDATKGGKAKKLSLKAEIDRDARMLQKWAFRQGWTMLDESFYDHSFHGTDWVAAYEHYAPYCTGTLIAEDFNHLMSRMLGELNASHLACYGGPARSGKSTGEMGFLTDPDYDGPGIRVGEVMPWGPTDQPEATVEPGEIVLAIDGVDIHGTERMYELLAGKVGERVKLTVAAEPEAEDARTMSVKPISSGALWNMDYERWVRDRREMVRRWSDGRIYYLHIRGMNSSSLQQFELDLQGQAQRHEALIIDVRFNGGGNTDQQKIHLLERKPYGWWGLRGEPLRPVPLWHGRGYDGPMCCLINEGSRSDAEVFPNAFRERGLGKLIGMPTPGWIIFTRNYTLVNGHGFRVPRWGWYRLDGVDLELTGVEPDIRVDWPYEAYRDGEDPQLRAAVDHLLEELEETGRAQRPEIPGYRYDIVP